MIILSKERVLEKIRNRENLSRFDTDYSLRKINLEGEDISGSFLAGIDAEQGNFRRCKGIKVDWTGSNLRFTDYSHADSTGSDYSYCDLRNSNLRGMIGIRVKWNGTDIRGADICGMIVSIHSKLFEGTIMDKKQFNMIFGTVKIK